MRSKAWLAAPVLLAHANVTENINTYSMGPKLRYTTVAATDANNNALHFQRGVSTRNIKTPNHIEDAT